MREPPDAFADVDVDAENMVVLNRKGLSVVDDWRRLPGHLIPEHLDDGLNGASGRNMQVFVHGEASFDEGIVGQRLELFHKVPSTTAGVVCPLPPFHCSNSKMTWRPREQNGSSMKGETTW